MDAGAGGAHPRVRSFNIPVERQGQEARVHLVTVEGARVAAYPLVVASRLDLSSDLAPMGAEQIDRDLKMPGLVHLDEPIERDPAERLRVSVVEAARAPLPDALVRLAPAPAHRVAKPVEHASGIAVETPTSTCKPRRGVEDFPVDVELELAVSIVAYAHRARAGVTLQISQLLLGQPGLTEHVVEHLEFGPGEACGVEHPAVKGLCFLVVAEGGEGTQRERCVAQPAVAVVP